MKPMFWELLVTDGHVRAARLRYLAPFGIAASILLVAVGWFVLNGAPALRFASGADAALRQRADLVRQPVLNAFARVPALSLSYTEVQNLTPEGVLPRLQEAITDGVNSGTFAPGLPLEEARSANDFWSWRWPSDKVITLNRGNLRAFGAVVLLQDQAGQAVPYGQQRGSRPVRWLAVFRKFPAGWDNIAIQGNGFIAPPGEKTTSPGDIPLSLRKLMDMPDGLQ